MGTRLQGQCDVRRNDRAEGVWPSKRAWARVSERIIRQQGMAKSNERGHKRCEMA